jgi:hypothetical protein
VTKKPLRSVETAAAAVAAAEANCAARANRLEELRASVEAINSDLVERRAALSGLAEDGAAFREALGFISSEEDRARVISETLIPASEGALAVAIEDERKADKAYLVARALAALERMESADGVTKAAFASLAEALSKSLEIRAEIQPVVCADGVGFGFDPIHAGHLYSAAPVTLQRFFREMEPKNLPFYADGPTPF